MSDLLRISYYPLEEIHREIQKYSPVNAHRDTEQAISKVAELQKQGVIKNGLFYIVLVDLADSTKYVAVHGNQKASLRIKNFVTSTADALKEARISNVGVFVKEIGDAVLFIFQHFPDILRWKARLDDLMARCCTEDEPMQVKTCIHIGEIFLDGVNPLSLAVSQTFKMEKSVRSGDIVLSNLAYMVAWPAVARAHHGFEVYGTVELDGFKEPLMLHKLVVHDDQDTDRIVLEQHD